MTKTCSGEYIVTDESCDLYNASIFPDEDVFIEWLEATAEEHLAQDDGMIAAAVKVEELLTPEVLAAIRKAALSSQPATGCAENEEKEQHAAYTTPACEEDEQHSEEETQL